MDKTMNTQTLNRKEWPIDHMGYENAVWHTPIIAGLVAAYPEAVYHEIGVLRGDCWRSAAANAAEAHGVDVMDSWPYMDNIGQLWHMKSQQFFREYDGPPPDVVFVDGDHYLPTCRNDVFSALSILAPGGTIAVHDTLPPPITRRELSGDGWQVREELERNMRLETFTIWRYPGLTFVRAR